MAKTKAQLDREIAEALTKNRAHAPIAGARAAKTKAVHVVQGNYGYGHGWEDLTAEDTRKEALVRLREYRENESAPFRVIRRRERIGATTGSAHARKKKIDHHEAKRRLQAAGIDFSLDSDQLRMSEAQLVADTARLAGYRKRKDAPGSTSRMYFQYLRRLK